MKEEIKLVLRDISKECINCNLDPDLVYPYLEFNQAEIDLIERETTRAKKLLKLFILLQANNDDVVYALQKTFHQQNLLDILNLMQMNLGEHGLGNLIWKPVTKPKEHTYIPETVHDIPMYVSVINFFDHRSTNLFVAQKYLRNHLKTKCEYIAKFWIDCLKEWDMSTAYVNLELLTNKGDKTGISLKKYEEVFLRNDDRKEIHKRILIEGDPGYGKSTYANKIALDWANKVDQWLCTRFKFVFLFELKHLTSVEDSLNSIFPPSLHGFISKEMNRPKNETLFIFDGFDELEEFKATYEQIQSILHIDKYPYVTCIVTSRRSHIDKIPSVAKYQQLIITGFTEDTVNEFMKMQKCPPLDANEKQTLYPLLTVPLFCTIYCSLKNVGKEQNIVSFFDLIQALVRSTEIIHLKKSSQLEQQQSAKDLKRDLNILGKFAVSILDSKCLDVIKYINESALNFEVKNEELEMVKLGLLIKKKVPTGIFDEFKNECSFAHQMIAEYFAAQYVSEITNLESINPQWLATSIDLPLVQFLLRIILSEWSMRNYNDECVKSFLDVPEIYWTWICSQSEVVLSQFICVRIWYSSECDSLSIVKHDTNNIFDVSLRQSAAEYLKSDFLKLIEKQMNSKITGVMLFRTESWFTIELKLIDFIKPVFLDLHILDENQNNSVNCEGITDIPETCGVIEDLVVETVDIVPSMLAFDPMTTYRNFTKPKGLALVINNRKFNGPNGLPERIGTDVDAKNISNLLEKLDYQVKVKTNLTVSEIESAMERFAKKKEHETCDSTVVVILTHGAHGSVYGSDNNLLAVDKFVAHLNSIGAPTLVNKPKIFIIQACRGELCDAGNDSTGGLTKADLNPMVKPVDVLKPADIITSVDQADALFKKVPLEADILIAYATTPGYVSWRNPAHGSWFIQSICEVFRRNARKEEIQHLFIEVNRLVADKLSTSGHVQVPEPNSRMRKKFYFFPGIYFDPNNM